MENAETYPLVSVIIPTYNRAALLQETIESVLQQTYPHIEVIVADDGSADDTKTCITNLGDHRVKFLSLEHSGHPGVARNQAVAKSTGDWIAFIDSDDLWATRKLEWQVKRLFEENKHWSFGGFNEMGKQDPPGSRTVNSNDLVKDILDNKIPVFIGTIMVRRSVFQAVGGFSEETNIAFREDFDLALRLSLHSDPVILPEILTRVREHRGRSTNQLDNSYQKTWQVYEKFIQQVENEELRRTAKKRQSYLLSEAAANKKLSLGFGQRFNLLRRSFRNDKLAHWLHSLWRSVSL